MTESISITQGFLAQALFETEQEIMKNPAYEGTGEVYNVSTFLLAEAFRYLMGTIAQTPGYGVKDGVPEEMAKAVMETQYNDLSPEQKAVVDEQGRILESLLKDPPARILILGLIAAYKDLQDARNEEVSQDSAGDS